jgi:hypothetical protein
MRWPDHKRRSGLADTKTMYHRVKTRRKRIDPHRNGRIHVCSGLITEKKSKEKQETRQQIFVTIYISLQGIYGLAAPRLVLLAAFLE